jgi:hypothetical protein
MSQLTIFKPLYFLLSKSLSTAMSIAIKLQFELIDPTIVVIDLFPNQVLSMYSLASILILSSGWQFVRLSQR